MESPAVRRALISVSDKAGLNEFAQGLMAAGIEIYSTGGTRKHLEAAGVAVRDIAAYTGFPEMMHGRLKTLHPKVFGGILARLDEVEDRAAMEAHGIVGFELVVVNLYPFEATVARPGVTAAEAIEQIDIGGPSLVRAAAKNHAFVTVATDARQYAEILTQVKAAGSTTLGLRRQLAAAAFAHTARYDQGIAAWFARNVTEDATALQHADGTQPELPTSLHLELRRAEVLRYGENPHQPAGLYSVQHGSGLPWGGNSNLVSARKLNGKELSYNNLLDLDSALAIVRSLASPAVAVIKHNNPCGAAEAKTLAEATRLALAGDPVSAFGSVLGFNRPVDLATAEILVEPGQFIEAIVAPEYEPAALEALTTRPKWKANVRLMQVGPISPSALRWELRQLDGGFLAQAADVLPDDESQWQVVTQKKPTDEQRADLRFAWSLVRSVKSNAIVLAKDRSLLGVGAGQMSRVDSVKIAIEKAGPRGKSAVLGSDAFFPFADSIHSAAAAGVVAAIQPGGSKNDTEVIEACNQHGIAMIFTGRRHFKH